MKLHILSRIFALFVFSIPVGVAMYISDKSDSIIIEDMSRTELISFISENNAGSFSESITISIVAPGVIYSIIELISFIIRYVYRYAYRKVNSQSFRVSGTCIETEKTKEPETS